MIKEILVDIWKLCNDSGISSPYIVGGVPRDTYLKIKNRIDDIDITTGDDTVFRISEVAYKKLRGKYPNMNVIPMSDGHSRISIDKIKIDFSTNYVSPKAIKKFPSYDKLMLELVSRDFTINTLLMTLDFSTIRDFTKRAYNDLDEKIIKTCMAPEITLVENYKRCVRAIYLAAKLGFNIDESVKNFISKNPDLLNVNARFTSDKLVKAFEYDKERTKSLLVEMDLWEKIKVTDNLFGYMRNK